MGLLRWIDEKNRLFGLIHWVDLLVVIASLLVIGKAVFDFWPAGPSKEKVTVYISLLSPNLRPEIAEEIYPGQWLKDARSGVQVGTIMEKKVAPHFWVHWVEGKPVKAADERTVDLRLTLKRTATLKEDEGIFIGPLALRAGRKGGFYTMNAEFYGEIIRVAKTRNEQSE